MELRVGRHTILVDDDFVLPEGCYISVSRDHNTWYASLFARGRTTGKYVCRLHSFIMGTRECVDHKNRNGLDNRRENLRVASRTQNMVNSKKKNLGSTSSRFKGVCWMPKIGKWYARICVHGRRIFLGSYSEETHAAYAYDVAARNMVGEFANTNFGER